MARLSAAEIYDVALRAGFAPDQAVTFTAIALAESGGDPSAHATVGEDSRGLWQINVSSKVRPNKWGDDLFDPLTNARAAYEVSNGGRIIRPWSVTHDNNQGTSRDFRQYLDDAQAAAAGSGAVGVDRGGAGATEAFVQAALAQTGDSYVFGAETRMDDPDPKTFDCSELVQWAAHRAGVEVPDGSWNQYLQLQRQGGAIDVEQALRTPGALLFSFSSPPTSGAGRPSQAHVAISLGDGRTIEAKGTQYGVGSWPAGNRFNYAAVIPQLATSTSLPGAAAVAPGDGTAFAFQDAALPPPTDKDEDGLTDYFEKMLGTAVGDMDTDHDGLSDLMELTETFTDPLKADTDADGVLDGIEVADGTDAGHADLPDAVVAAGFGGAAMRDTDDDGLSDLFEYQIGSDRHRADTDLDGLADGLEYAAGGDLTTIDSDNDGITDAVEDKMGTLGIGLPPPGAGPVTDPGGVASLASGSGFSPPDVPDLPA